MKFLKLLVVILTIFASSVFVYGYLYEKEIINLIADYYDRNPDVLVNNEYKKEIEIDFVKLTDNFEPDTYGDLVNIYYTIIYSGMDEFTFYCHKDYINCIPDIVEINNDKDLLSQLNNFVNVFNSFKSIKTTYTSNGKVTLSVNKIYSNDDIMIINNKLDKLENEILQGKENDYDKVLAIHDYIVNNTKYNIADENKAGTASSNAIGVLFNHLATCNGYTDAASILLDRANIPNVRISNDKHIWNLVYVNGKWLHLDVTWDDPINKLDIDKQVLSHDYFLKTSSEFEEIGLTNPESKHNFSKSLYNFVS